MGVCAYHDTGFCSDAACRRDGECKAHSTASGAHLKDDPDLAQFADLASAIGLREAHLPLWVRASLVSMRRKSKRDYDILMRPAGAWAEGHYQVKALALLAGRGADWSIAKTVGALKGLAWELISQIEEVQMGFDLAAPGADRTVALHHKPLLQWDEHAQRFFKNEEELKRRAGMHPQHAAGYGHKPLLAKGGFAEGLIELLERQNLSTDAGTPWAIACLIADFSARTFCEYVELVEQVEALRKGL